MFMVLTRIEELQGAINAYLFVIAFSIVMFIAWGVLKIVRVIHRAVKKKLNNKGESEMKEYIVSSASVIDGKLEVHSVYKSEDKEKAIEWAQNNIAEDFGYESWTEYLSHMDPKIQEIGSDIRHYQYSIYDDCGSHEEMYLVEELDQVWNEESGTVVYGEDFSPLSDELLTKEMEKRGLLSKKVPLVTTYSFDQDTPVFLFDSQEEAAAELKRQFNEELRIQTEENGHVEGTDLEIKFSDDKLYASITIYYDDQKDVIEWSVGDIKN